MCPRSDTRVRLRRNFGCWYAVVHRRRVRGVQVQGRGNEAGIPPRDRQGSDPRRSHTLPTLPSHPPSPRAHHRRPPRSLSPRPVRCFLPPPPSSLFVLSAPTRARTASPPFRTVPSASACWGRHTIENWAQPCFVSLVSAVCTAHTRDNEAYKISAQQPHVSPAFATARSSLQQLTAARSSSAAHVGRLQRHGQTCWQNTQDNTDCS